MSAEHLQTYTLLHTEKILSIREYYYQNLKKELSTNAPEDSLPFAGKNMYECWINYSPLFFKDLKEIYTHLLQKGYPEDLSPFIENKARVTRYFAQILLPGAYLDQETPTEEKIDFLNKFAITAQKVMHERYNEPNPEILYNPKPLNDRKRKAIAQLIGVLDEACELIYFGDQTVGFPAFGLDKKAAFPENYTLYQDFDINLGVKTFPDIERIKTYTVYPQHEHTAQPYIMILDKASVHLFLHGFWNDYKWIEGRPHSSFLIKGGVIVGDEELSMEEIEHMNNLLLRIIDSVNKNRAIMNQEELNIEYCITQSNAIKNLNQTGGRDWNISSDVKKTLVDNEIVKKLKRDWGLDYSFEVAFELINKSIQWVKDLTR